MKVTTILSYAISLIFIVMGILILTVLPLDNTNLRPSIKISFGVLLIIYGLWRGYKGYAASKRKDDENETGNNF